MILCFLEIFELIKEISFTKCSHIFTLHFLASPEVLMASHYCEQVNMYIFVHDPEGINKLVRLHHFKVKNFRFFREHEKYKRTF